MSRWRLFSILPLALYLLVSCKSPAPQATAVSPAPVTIVTAPPAPPTAATNPATRPMVSTTAPVASGGAIAAKASVVPGNGLPPVPAEFPLSSDPRKTLPFLASDELAGRMPGTAGLVKAGDFLAANLSNLRLSPLPGQDYFQPFSMMLSVTLDPACSLVVNQQPQLLSRDFNPLSVSASGEFHGPMVFAGFGITRSEGDYDDYAHIDARGKVVLAMMKEPLDSANKSRFAQPHEAWSQYATFTAKAKNAAAHGAVALLLVSPPSSGGLDSVNPYFGNSATHPTDIPVLQVTRRVADLLLAEAEMRDLKSLQDTINASFKPASGDLSHMDAAGNVVVTRRQASVRNVMACLGGVGPTADEWVVVGAHYDHLGTGQLGHMAGGKAGQIFHGADDNASGTAAVLELADRLKKSGPLPRSVLFVFFTGEEEGLIGSQYFVDHPPIPLNKVVAMLNLDMVGRLNNDTILLGGQATAPIFSTMVPDAIVGTHLKTSTFERGGLGPSDHCEFALQRIPVLFLFTGLHPDYHRPTDTADKINYDGIDQIVQVAQKITNAMAGMPRQQYNGSEDSGSTLAAFTGHGDGRRASLGVVPDYSANDGKPGVLISGVGQNTAAEAAGLQAGDRLIGFNTTVLDSLQDLSDALANAKPGDSVTIKLIRNMKSIEVHAVLGERK